MPDYLTFVSLGLAFITKAMEGQSPAQQEGLCAWFIQLHDKAVSLPPLNKIGIPIAPLVEAARQRIQAAQATAAGTVTIPVAPPTLQAVPPPASIAAASATPGA